MTGNGATTVRRYFWRRIRLAPVARSTPCQSSGDRDRCDFKFLQRLGNQPAVQNQTPPFRREYDVPHQSLLPFVNDWFKDFCGARIKSLCHARASAGEVLLVQCVRQILPVQTFSVSGMIRASALPFLTSTKLRFDNESGDAMREISRGFGTEIAVSFIKSDYQILSIRQGL